MSSTVEQIKERLGIEEVVSSYLKLERAGKNWKAKCPFHNEKTPSFFVSPERGSYYCFGCGAKGDIFTFVGEFEGLDFKGALRILAERAGVTLGEWNKEDKDEKEKLYRIVEEAARFFEKNLAGNPAALEYLRGRGVTDGTVKSFRLGLAEDAWRSLHSYLLTSGFSEREMEQAGLVKRKEGGGFYDRFRGRIMFPIADSSGRIIAFSGRVFGKTAENPENAKYLNSPETIIFKKSAVLYGLDRAKDSIRKHNFSILVEGQMDLILSHQAGFRNTVASSGTALAEPAAERHSVSNLELLRRLSENVVLAFDGDRAGISAALRAGRIALLIGMNVKVAEMEKGLDPADTILKKGADAWRMAIRGARHMVDFLLEKALSEVGNDPHRIAKNIREKVLPYAGAIESSIEKAEFLKKISEVSGVRESALLEDLMKVEREIRSASLSGMLGERDGFSSARAPEASRMDHIVRRILSIILWQRSLQAPAVDPASLTTGLLSVLNTGEDELLSLYAPAPGDLIFEAEALYGPDADLAREVKELMFNLKEERLKETLAEKLKGLADLEKSGNTDDSARMLSEIHALTREIQDIKDGKA